MSVEEHSQHHDHEKKLLDPEKDTINVSL